MVGQTISRYKIVEKLGSGGMGDVYEAEDLRLGRHVALKFLAAHLVSDAEIRKRFEREAKAAAALSHPNICTVHEIDEVDGKIFLVMELVKGESLEARIANGPLPLKDALDFGRQIAEGLQEAHANGVVHRDIKPGNIIVLPDGRVKILDFGLALLTEGSKLTRLDTTVGTVAYMSPEQAQGLKVDRRTDVWSLGCVLYEMTTAQRAFLGHYDQAVVYSILNEAHEPITGLRAGVPMELEVFVGKCLNKEPTQRYAEIGELGKDLRSLAERIQSGRSTVVAAAARRSRAGLDGAPEEAGAPRKRLRLAWAACGLAVLTAIAAIGLVVSRPTEPPQRPLRRFTLTPPVPVDIDTLYAGVAVSPDGRHVAFTTAQPDGKLWIQTLDQLKPHPLDGTEGARLPFWSPDSSFIGFQTETQIKKISVQGGVAIPVGETPGRVFGGTWSPDGQTMVVGGLHGMFEIPAAGGPARQIISNESISNYLGGGAVVLVRPHFLPAEAGQRVLVFNAANSALSTMVVEDLDTGRRVSLGPGDRPFYSSSGHLIYQPGLNVYDLWAVPFSLQSLSATAAPFPIAQGARQPSTSGDQTLIYLDGSGSLRVERKMVWMNREGNVVGEIGVAPAVITGPEISPNGTHVAFLQGEDIWVWSLDGGARSRLKSADGQMWKPVWSPDGDQIAYAGKNRILSRRADGGGSENTRTTGDELLLPSDWSRDGRYLVYEQGDPTGADIGYLEQLADGTWQRRPFDAAPDGTAGPRLSPDSRYVAYMSSESGGFEIQVKTFPDGDRQWTISANGGLMPRWSDDGKELFYIEGNSMMAVPISNESTFSPGAPIRLFDFPNLLWYDVASDGRFLVVSHVDDGTEKNVPPASIRIVENWFEEFRDPE